MASPAPSPSLTTSSSRKRKYDATDGPASRSSPAPTDQNPDEPTVLSARSALSRPRLTVSRGPVFASVPDKSDWFVPEQIAHNRLGFRYYHAGLAAPNSVLPYRTIESRPEGYVRVSWEDRSALLKVTADGLGLQGDKGFRGARCNVPVREGSWYTEVKVECGGGDNLVDEDGGQYVRLGWARREAPLQGPAGLDGYSYGYRDKTGEKVTLSRARPYGMSYKSGDVIGMYISLPPLRQANPDDPFDPARRKRERIPIDYKGQEYFETREYPQTKEMIGLMDAAAPDKIPNSVPSTKKSATVKNVADRGRRGGINSEPESVRSLPVLEGSEITFFVNGQSQGVAFQDIYDFLPMPAPAPARKTRERDKFRHKDNLFDDGWLGYYPFISLFNTAQVRLNPGPVFDFPPPLDFGVSSGKPPWRPLSERYAEFMQEQWALDDYEEEEAKKNAASAGQEQTPPEETPKPTKTQQKLKRRDRKLDGESVPPAKSSKQKLSDASKEHLTDLSRLVEPQTLEDHVVTPEPSEAVDLKEKVVFSTSVSLPRDTSIPMAENLEVASS